MWLPDGLGPLLNLPHSGCVELFSLKKNKTTKGKHLAGSCCPGLDLLVSTEVLNSVKCTH